MMFNIIVHITYSRICSFTDVSGFMDQVVYLACDRLAHNSKNSTFMWSFEVNWPGLHGVCEDLFATHLLQQCDI